MFLLTATAGFALAQDAVPSDYQPSGYVVPPVVYEAPLIYAAPVVYQAPVVYYAPVYYGSPEVYAPAPCEARACDNLASRSTVTYIGGGQTRFQVAPRCNYGSTVTVIGHSWRR